MPPLVERWNSLADDDKGLLPLLECFTSIAQAPREMDAMGWMHHNYHYPYICPCIHPTHPPRTYPSMHPTPPHPTSVGFQPYAQA